MISVTDLTGYMYCSRKLFLNKVLYIREKPSVVGLKGTIKHAVFEDVGREDRTVIFSFQKGETLEGLEAKYRLLYYKVLMYHIQKRKKDLETQGLKTILVYQELWPFFLEEAKDKSVEFYTLAQERGLYGEALWLSLPKAIPELKIISSTLGLTGVIDRVEVGDIFIPIEIKTGNAPKEGVWRENMIQLGAYMLLLSEHYGKKITEGYIEYRAINERRKVFMNAFLKDEILELLEKVKKILNAKEVPEKTKDSYKCSSCGIKEQCYAFT